MTKDQNTAAGTWVALGSYSLKQGNDAQLKLDQNGGGKVVADAVKLVRDTTDDTDGEKHSFTYAYDVNANLTSIDDTSAGAKIDAYTIAYTGLNQVQKVTEALAGQEKKATSFTYDDNGRPETVTHPDQFAKYTYDLRQLVTSVSVGKSAADTSPKVTSYTYTDRGLKLRETKANQSTVDYTYYLNGAARSTTEKKGSGTLVSSHTYPRGDRAFFERIDAGEVGRGDVVLHRAEDRYEGRPVLRRVIGIGGDHVRQSSGGPVTVNGRPLTEPYVKDGDPSGTAPAYDVVVPEGRLFLLGDHRANSNDSRFSLSAQSGSVAATTVQARALDDHMGLLLLVLTALFGLLGTVGGLAMEIAARVTRRGSRLPHPPALSGRVR
ncbi:signal peptidase I [Streptomyces sp. NPDC096153]|uniref:signal peptidase I n=1 Tax=Streptomyces sp. NPDC096153 TaxID=3155548 RepID=UPI003321F7D8